MESKIYVLCFLFLKTFLNLNLFKRINLIFILKILLILLIYNINFYLNNTLEILLKGIFFSFIFILIEFICFIFNKNKRKIIMYLYFVSIILNILIILLVEYFFNNKESIYFNSYLYKNFIIYLIYFLFIGRPINNIIKKGFYIYRPFIFENNDYNTGGIIGFLERNIISFSIFFNYYSGISIIVACKSLARYEKISKEKRFSEYYLLGTFSSIILTICLYYFIFKFNI